MANPCPFYNQQLTVPIGAALCTECAVQADICFLIDSSGSIRDNNPADGSFDNWNLLLGFVRAIVNSFPIR